MIYDIPANKTNGYPSACSQVKTRGVLLPGRYKNRKAAQYSTRFPDETLEQLHEEVNLKQNRNITYDDLRELGV